MTNLKPFNLERALVGDLIEYIPYGATSPVLVKLVYVSKIDINCKYLLVRETSTSCLSYWATENDLFMAPTIKKYWFNVYKKPSGAYYTGEFLYTTEEAAISMIKDKNIYIKTHFVEIEE